jgi:cell division protein FtsB
MDGNKAVKYPNLIAPVIQAIKEFYAKYLKQEEKINQLENNIKSLEKTVNILKLQVEKFNIDK